MPPFVAALFLGVVAFAATAAAADRVVFDLDLTRGSAGTGAVTGGKWDSGWRTTGVKGERIVFDAGGPIVNGVFEVSVTVDALPWTRAQGKINWAGLHEDIRLTQNSGVGDIFYARTGQESYKFSNVKAGGRPFDRTVHEPRLGETTDWIADDRTVMTVKFEWRDGVAVFHDPKGRATVFARDVLGADTPVDTLRYAWIGFDNYTGLTVPGLRFTRVKLTDFGPRVDGPPPPALRVAPGNRILSDADGRPVFLLAAPAPPAGADLTDYLLARRHERFNAVRIAADSAAPDHLGRFIAETKRLGLYAVVSMSAASAVVAAPHFRAPHVIWSLDGSLPSVRALAAKVGTGAILTTSIAPSAELMTEPWLSFATLTLAADNADPRAALAKAWSLAPAKPLWVVAPGAAVAPAWLATFAGACGIAPAGLLPPLARFMNSLRFSAGLSRLPDSALVAGADSGVAASRIPNRNLSFYYAPAGRGLRVNLDRLAPGPLHVWWFNPRTGRWRVGNTETDAMTPTTDAIPSGPGTPPREFAPPAPEQDWVLVLGKGLALS